MAGTYKITIEQGATFALSLTWKTGDPATPVNLTGCTGKMQIRQSIVSDTVLWELNAANGGVTFGGATGVVNLKIPATATADFSWTSGVYDLEVTFADGTVKRLLAGQVVVSPGVTR